MRTNTPWKEKIREDDEGEEEGRGITYGPPHPALLVRLPLRRHPEPHIRRAPLQHLHHPPFPALPKLTDLSFSFFWRKKELKQNLPELLAVRSVYILAVRGRRRRRKARVV
jgi:hypothetical protein